MKRKSDDRTSNKDKASGDQSHPRSVNKGVVNHLAHNPNNAEIAAQQNQIDIELKDVEEKIRGINNGWSPVGAGWLRYLNERKDHLERLKNAIVANVQNPQAGDISDDNGIIGISRNRIVHLRSTAQSDLGGAVAGQGRPHSEEARKEAVAELCDIVGVMGATVVCTADSDPQHMDAKALPTLAWISTMIELMHVGEPMRRDLEEIRVGYINAKNDIMSNRGPADHPMALTTMRVGIRQSLVDKGIIEEKDMDGGPRYLVSEKAKKGLLQKLSIDLGHVGNVSRAKRMANRIQESLQRPEYVAEEAFSNTNGVLEEWESTAESGASKATVATAGFVRKVLGGKDVRKTNAATAALYNHFTHAR